MKSLIALVIFMTAFLPFSTMADEAQLILKRDGHSVQFGASALLQRKDVRQISVVDDVAYKKNMQYLAIPLKTLLSEQHFSPEKTLNFLAMDGFAAPIPASLVLKDKEKSQAWLAVEEVGSPWPPLSNNGKASAGPFYLVWLNPQDGNIKQEQWPYQIASIEEISLPEQRFPMIQPDNALPAGNPVWIGFSVYKTHCLACHKMNGGGDGTIGPDLNRPENPTRYFQEKYLKRLIRNPAQVRSWPDSKMPSFDNKAISESELDALVLYLEHMAERE